jgi:probable F420-dependent oxidoreductase
LAGGEHPIVEGGVVMAHVELGRHGAVIAPTEGPELVETAVALEALGFPTIWLTGGPLTSLQQVADVVRATDHVTVATGILAVVIWPSEDVEALYTDLERTDPGRFVVGLGGAHGPDPIPTLEGYLDRLGAVPQSRRVLAALGPRMFRMAREKAAGALPVLVTPERTAEARELLGPEPTLAVDQLLVLESDRSRAREIGRGPLKFLATMPAYQANFRRMGFTDEDIESLSDRLVDALVPGGSPEAIAAHVVAQHQAGADHVGLSLVSEAETPPLEQWRALAAAVLI